MYIAFLWHRGPSQIWWSASNDSNPLNLCACQLFSSSLACWRISCFIGQTQNLTSVGTVVTSTSIWSASPGPNSPTFTWCMVQCMATAGKHRGFISIFWTEYVQTIVCLLLSTVTYGKLVHLQWTGKTQGEDNQFTCHNLMMVCSILRTVPPKAPALLVT
jgi:hypothetical protein